MARNNQRGRNNNPEGRNQYSSGWMNTAKDRPMTTALGAAAAVGAGVFLWSRRNQISEQLSNLSDQIGEWTESMGSSSSDGEFEMAGGSSSSSASGSRSSGSTGSSSTGSSSRGRGRSTSGMSTTGGGNASLGAQSGGNGIGSGNA